MTPSSRLFKGLKFYLSYHLPKEKRVELKELIEQNGGLISVNEVGSIQLVDHDKLSAKHDWVSANFVYDSIQKGECLDRIDYVHVSNPTPSKKKKNPYTVEDDAKMLWYIEEKKRQDPSFKHYSSIPRSFWQAACEEKITNRSMESMRERYRKILIHKTPEEKRQILDSLPTDWLERRGNTSTGLPARKPSPSRKRTSEQQAANPSDDQETDIEGRAKRRQRLNQNSSSNKSSHSLSMNESTSIFAKGTPTTSNIKLGTEGAPNSREASQEKCLLVQSQWERIVSQGETETYFSMSSTPLKCRVNETSASHEESFGKIQIATESEGSYLDDAGTEEVLIQLQFEANQDQKAVVHAIYYASGDVETARKFLKGLNPEEMWTAEEDKSIKSLSSTLPHNIESAMRAGGLNSLSKHRSVNDIAARLQYLV